MERARYVESLTIAIPQFVSCVQLIDGLIEKSGALADPGGLRVIGAPGVGKSCVHTHIVRNHPATDGPSGRRCPILSISTVSEPTTNQIVTEMLRAVGYHYSSSQTAADKTEILMSAVRACHVKVVLVDEFQQVVEGGRGKIANAIADWFKRFYDDTQVPIVFFGTPTASKVFEINTQLATRISATFEIAPLGYDATFVGLLRAFDQALPMDEPCGLGESRLAQAIHRATEGNLRMLKKLLKEAVLVAATDEAPALRDTDFQRAFFRVAGSRPNPFGTTV